MSMLDLDVLTVLERDLGDKAMVREVVELYLEQLPQRERAVSDAAATGDQTAIRREAHALGSASAMVGAALLCTLCRDLETRDPSRPVTATDPLLMAWASVCDETEVALKSWLRQP